jgi:hypothetical protein
MTTEPLKKQSIFPDYPRANPSIDKDGNLAVGLELGLSALFQALQANFKDEGIVIPPLSAADMTTIQNLYTSYIGGAYNTLAQNLPDISSQTVYDSTTQITNQFVIAQDNSSNVTLAQWVPFAMMLTYPGNPNGHVPGVLNWLCLNTATPTLYACTVAGAIGTAVWTSL